MTWPANYEYSDDILWTVESWRGKRIGWVCIEVFFFLGDAETWIKRKKEQISSVRSKFRIARFVRNVSDNRAGEARSGSSPCWADLPKDK